jgi:hypothetical protein
LGLQKKIVTGIIVVRVNKTYQMNDHFKESQQGSGSAENVGKEREAQKNQMADISGKEKQEIAAQMGKGPNPVTDIRQMGGVSGRDDHAGESEGMRDQSTNENTDR